MPPTAVLDSSAVALMHAPGRVRIKVPGLYRSEALKDRLEKNLAGQRHVRAVYANPLTGNLLLLFDAAVPAETMLADIGVKTAKKEAPAASRQRRKAGARARPQAAAPSGAPPRAASVAQPACVRVVTPRRMRAPAAPLPAGRAGPPWGHQWPAERG